MDNLAPIALFVYKRLDHVKETIQALTLNRLATNSDLYIFSDAPKGNGDVSQVSEVRRFIVDVIGFNSVHIIHRSSNLGLAKNIINGVTELSSTFGKVIVLEDDIVTSPLFLTFMNDSLKKYEKDPRVWHICGYSFPINIKLNSDTYFWRGMNCWGWGTWQSRWKYFEKNPQGVVEKFTTDDIKRFDLDGTKVFWPQVLGNANNKMNTWAIFWYVTIFINNGLCLQPKKSYVENIGFDGTGENCNKRKMESGMPLNLKSPVSYPLVVQESDEAVFKIREYYMNNKSKGLKRILKKLFLR